ncbi:MAG: hypothetical protein Q4E69_02305 [Bacilli bacterium]|nr:hypothetical protein [Bacilli bacterium]
MDILGKRGYECSSKFIDTFGSVNIDCINKFMREYTTLVNSSNYIGLILENIDSYEGINLEERVNTVGIYSNLYDKSYKNCFDINRILTSNGTLDKIGTFNNKEFNLINNYFNDYKIFIGERDYSYHDIGKLKDDYNELVKIKKK